MSAADDEEKCPCFDGIFPIAFGCEGKCEVCYDAIMESPKTFWTTVRRPPSSKPIVPSFNGDGDDNGIRIG